MVMRIALVAMMVACGSDAPVEPDAGAALACSDDLAALYDRGCSLTNGVGQRFGEDDVRDACAAYIASAEPGCASRIAEFRGCLAPQTDPPTQVGVSVICE